MEQKGARKSQSQRQSVEQPLDVEAVLSGTVAAVEEDPNKEYNRVRPSSPIIFALWRSSHCLTVVDKIMYPILFAGVVGSHTVQSGLSVQRAAGDEVSGQGQPHGEGARRGAHAALR